MTIASHIKWVKKYIANKESYWALLFKHFMEKAKINLDVLFYADYEIKDLECKQVPDFYVQLLKSWVKTTGTTIPRQSYIWYNKNI